MKITSTGLSQSAGVRRKDGRQSGGESEFSVDLPSATRGAPRGSAPAISGLDALLAAQEVPGATEEKRRARETGETILDRLEELRHGLLAGTITGATMRALADAVRRRRDQFTDPRLSEIMSEIELRAEVELAKLEVQA